MICTCGSRYPDNDEKCTFCGALNHKYAPPTPETNSTTIDLKAFDKPADPWDAFPGKKPKSQEEGWQGSEADRQLLAKQGRRARFSANASVLCGVLGNVFYGPIFGPIAIFLGIRAKKVGFRGTRATVGIALGILAIVFWMLAMVLILVIIPRFAPELLPVISELLLW